MVQRDIKETVSEEKGVYSGAERELAFKKHWIWTSLVAQWIRICLPVQGTWVQSLVWEDSTCRRATKPMHALEPVLYKREALAPQLQSKPFLPQLEKACTKQ